MFGFIRPRKPDLRVWEYELFRAAYCGLCHTLGNRYGFLWRFLLNYDFCYLAILLSGASGDPCAFCDRRCIASPFQRRRAMQTTPSLEYSADATVLLSYYKVRDGIRDEHGIKKLGLRVLSFLMRHGYRRAALHRPALDRSIHSNMAALDALEDSRNPSLDRAADTFAKILAAASEDIPVDQTARPLRELLYHTGRWIYIADAWNDVSDDLKSGSYNPIILRNSLTLPPSGKDADTLSETLELSCAAAAASFSLMKLGSFEGIVGNVVYLGMPAVAKQIRSGSYQPLNVRKRGKSHGSL
ncbi:MAG: DUF5685 family protein [Clostridiaceae bacterium]|nr:DUF5685 family protein [Clostridiaceae bacterium]